MCLFEVWVAFLTSKHSFLKLLQKRIKFSSYGIPNVRAEWPGCAEAAALSPLLCVSHLNLTIYWTHDHLYIGWGPISYVGLADTAMWPAGPSRALQNGTSPLLVLCLWLPKITFSAVICSPMSEHFFISTMPGTEQLVNEYFLTQQKTCFPHHTHIYLLQVCV